MLGCFNSILGQTWTNVGLKMQFKNVTQRLGLSVFDRKTQHFLECIHNLSLKSERWHK